VQVFHASLGRCDVSHLDQYQSAFHYFHRPHGPVQAEQVENLFTVDRHAFQPVHYEYSVGRVASPPQRTAIVVSLLFMNGPIAKYAFVIITRYPSNLPSIRIICQYPIPGFCVRAQVFIAAAAVQVTRYVPVEVFHFVTKFAVLVAVIILNCTS
jgi:hypothetical protein